MEKKRSRGVTIFAWLLIIINLISLLFSLNLNTFFDMYKSFNKATVIAIIFYSLSSMIIGIIAGFGILRLKEIMRKLAVVINSIDVLFGIPLLLLSMNDLRQYSYSMAVAQAAKAANAPGIDALADIGFYVGISVSIFYIALSLLFIFFFTRAKVKEQFK